MLNKQKLKRELKEAQTIEIELTNMIDWTNKGYILHDLIKQLSETNKHRIKEIEKKLEVKE